MRSGRPGEIAKAAAELAAAKINVEAVTIVPEERVVFRTSDNERADQILPKM